jgi:hypothetical protein
MSDKIENSSVVSLVLTDANSYLELMEIILTLYIPKESSFLLQNNLNISLKEEKNLLHLEYVKQMSSQFCNSVKATLLGFWRTHIMFG